MADAEKSLEIVIRTKAELDGARAVEEALERDIAAARELERVGGEGERRGSGTEGDAGESAPLEKGTPSMLKHELQTTEEPIAEIPGWVRAAELRPDTSGIEAAGERLAGVLERNGRATIGMLQRAIEVAEEQSRRLSELERRLAELSQRIKGSYLK